MRPTELMPLSRESIETFYCITCVETYFRVKESGSIYTCKLCHERMCGACSQHICLLCGKGHCKPCCVPEGLPILFTGPHDPQVVEEPINLNDLSGSLEGTTPDILWGVIQLGSDYIRGRNDKRARSVLPLLQTREEESQREPRNAKRFLQPSRAGPAHYAEDSGTTKAPNSDVVQKLRYSRSVDSGSR